MTPSDMTVDYKVSSFLLLYSDFLSNLLGSTCTCHYLLVGTHVSRSVSLSMYASIRCAIDELHRHHGLDIHPWDPGPSWSMPQGDGEHSNEPFGRPPPWPPP
jgi:hypothetical protein